MSPLATSSYPRRSRCYWTLLAGGANRSNGGGSKMEGGHTLTMVQRVGTTRPISATASGGGGARACR